MVLLFYMNIKQPNIKANTLYTMQQVEKMNTGFTLKVHVVAVINIVERNTHRLKKTQIHMLLPNIHFRRSHRYCHIVCTQFS